MIFSPRAARPRRLRPAAAQALTWCGALAYPILLYVAVLSEHDPTGVGLLLPAVLSVLPLALLRCRPFPALMLMLAGSFAATVTAASKLASAFPFVAPGQAWQIGCLQALLTDLAVAWIAATRTRRTALAAAALTLAEQIAAAGHYRSERDVFVSTIMFFVLMLALAWLTGSLVQERREHAETVRIQAAEQAVTVERLRIARELHDVVAHSIGIIAIQAGTGRRVIETQPAEARNALAVIETTSRDTLAGLRRMLGSLRKAEPEGAPLAPALGLTDVDRLVATTRNGGVRVDVEWRGERRPLPMDIELSAFRIIQEGLTNVVRHADTQECRVVIDYQEDELSIEITDDGQGPTPAGIGYGVTGMRERALLLHGRFTAGPRPEGGFRVVARLPVPAGTR
ncbi:MULTISPECIES: sensor histidine kinase [unclassified Streptomyces]|uniref:sensor histidine kinase n=1 Tax=unclassified Streptomyces TaxID=2593676 RepID=UPI0006ADA1E7|nr:MULTISPECIES: sensor histidine kinase [unclassified Streptomyces]KOX25094.1 histidine kinase [Streptomyces sp. NRRL F-6491]KOX37055.1 histidine kinase [Streptomyces sp. NRRL F-6492]